MGTKTQSKEALVPVLYSDGARAIHGSGRPKWRPSRHWCQRRAHSDLEPFHGTEHPLLLLLLHPVLMHNTKNPHVNCMTIHQNKMGLTTMTKTQIDSLLRFTADGADVSIGSSYTGVWDDEATLRITLLDVTGAGLPSRTRVGKLVAAARSGNTLKSFDGSSPVATGSATLTGSWCVSCFDCWVLRSPLLIPYVHTRWLTCLVAHLHTQGSTLGSNHYLPRRSGCQQPLLPQPRLECWRHAYHQLQHCHQRASRVQRC